MGGGGGVTCVRTEVYLGRKEVERGRQLTPETLIERTQVLDRDDE